jgi:hypothetical protein
MEYSMDSMEYPMEYSMDSMEYSSRVQVQHPRMAEVRGMDIKFYPPMCV